MRKLTLTLALSCLTLPAWAEGDSVPPVQDALTQQECSACHMAYPPSLLPARSWSAIMTGLDNHFGEDASLDEAARAAIESYLVGAAGDANGRTFWGAKADQTPLRITELSWFTQEHSGEVSPKMLKRAGTMSNCTACHRGADKGWFEDD